MRRQIVEVVGRARRPMTLREVQAELPDVRREDLDDLVDRGVLYPCTRSRIWDRDETDHLLTVARSHLVRRPLSRRELAEVLAEHDPSLPRAWRSALYDRLRDASDIWEWPGGAGHRAARLATEPPDPDAYVGRLREQYERVRDRLADAGIDEAAIARAVTGEIDERPQPSPAAPPGNVLHELAFAWADTTEPEARTPIERVLTNIGARRLGTIDEPVSFDGRLHETDDDLFPDEPARVVEPGWVHGTAQTRVVLVKARVRATT